MPYIKLSKYIACLVIIVISIMIAPGVFAAVVDIHDMVDWDAAQEMYVPFEYTHAFNFDEYTQDNERLKGSLFLNFSSTDSFEVYLAASNMSDPAAVFTRATLDEVPDLLEPYSIDNFGYMPNGVSPLICYSVSHGQAGFGNKLFLDWQIQGENPMPQKSVYPGSIYYGQISGAGGTVNLAENLSSNFDTVIKVQALAGGGTTVSGTAITIAAPELPFTVGPILILLFATFFIRRKIHI